MAHLRSISLLAALVSSSAAAQPTVSPAFDGKPLARWTAQVLDDSSTFRRNRVAAAVKRAPPAFRRAFIADLTTALGEGNAERKTRALNAILVVVNEGQFGVVLEERGRDLAPAVAALQRIAADARDRERRAAIFMLARTDSLTRKSVAPAMRSFLGDPDAGVRWEVIRFLRLVNDPADVPAFLAATRDSAASVRETAIGVLSRAAPRRALGEFTLALDDPNAAVREAAISALGRAGPAASATIPRLHAILGDPTQGRSILASAAWALSMIIPRFSENYLRVELTNAGMGIRDDGLGAYIDGADSVGVTKGESLNLVLGHMRSDARTMNLKVVRPLRRALFFDLSRPVTASGAKPLGLIRDNEGISHIAFTHVHEKRMESITALAPNDTLTPVERVEFQFRINGAAHILQMGEWTQGEFNRNAPRISGAGTATATVAHPDAGHWTIVAPEGSRARLWDLSDRQRPVDRGLYIVPFKMRWSLIDQP